jgi:hypothetical protein
MSSWHATLAKPQRRPVSAPTKDTTVAITVCVNFADKLLATLELNSVMLKQIYVVTDPADKKTIDLCETFTNVHVILCPDAHKDGAKFNKSGLIRAAQDEITPTHRNDWIMIIDADTIIPFDFWSSSSSKQFYNDTVYLLRRKIYHSNAEFVKDKPTEITERGCGFFQLYYDKNKMYNNYSNSAADCDILFQNLFRNQVELPGYCMHLGQTGQDWNGRVSGIW